nr:MAK10-like protein [Tanacetum cinerariifolium]
MGDANPIRTLGDYSKPSHEGYRNTIELPLGNNVLRDRNAKESWELLEDLALYENESWNDQRDFSKPVKTISLPQDVSSTSDFRLIELENQVQCLMEAYLSPIQPTQVNKITTSCEICSGPYDTQYCMEDHEQAFVEYASSCTDEAGDKWASQDAKLSKFEADFKQQQSEMTNIIDTVLKAITDRIAGALTSDTQQSDSDDDKPEENIEEEKSSREDINANPFASFITKKVLNHNLFLRIGRLGPQLSGIKVVWTKRDDGDVMFIEIVKKNEDYRTEEPKEGGLNVEYFDIFPTRDELAYHKYLMLYLIRRSLEVLRKFHWMILRGRFN